MYALTRSLIAAKSRSLRQLSPAARRTLALTLLMAAAGCALGAFAFHWAPPQSRPVLTWWEIAPSIAVANGLGFHLEIRGEAHTFTLSELPLVLGCLFAPAWAVIVGRLLGEAVFQVGRRRQRGLKLAFNLSQFLFETVVILFFMHHLVKPGAVTDWAKWPLVLLAVLPGAVLTTVAVFCAIFWHGGRPRAGSVAIAGTATVVVNVNLAILAAVVLREYPGALALLLLVLVLTSFAFRGFTSLSKRYASLKLLYEFTKVVGASMSAEAVLDQMLSKARDLLSAEIAEVVLFDRRTGRAILRQRNSEGTASGSVVPIEPETAEPSWASLVRSGHAVHVARSDRSPTHVALRVELGVRDLILAPLRAEDAVIGAILVANRLGNVSTFDDGDRRLFETLANHTSVAFENSRLVQQLRQEADERRYEALHDSLTGLPNRAQFSQQVDRLTADGQRCAVMLMDLDRFKEVNDTLGHHNGDALLCKVAGRLIHALRAGDTAARLGGDEFAVLLPGVADVASAEVVAKNVLDALDEPFVLEELAFDVGASIGIALAPEHGVDATSLLQRADVAMYQAKASHTGFAPYLPERDVHSPRRLALANALRQAIENGDLLVYFQPQARVVDGQVVGAETLVRWRHPELGLLPPDEFIPTAEQTGLIAPLTTYVLRAGLRQCREWRTAGFDMSIAVNLAVRSLLDTNLPLEIGRLLTESGVQPEWLTLEITESSVMADPGRTIAVLQRLASAGVRLSVDDFGTGYSSLAYLQRLPVHEVKVDKSFVFRMSSDAEDAMIVQSIIELGHNLGLTVVAEGVEDQISWDRLRSMNCDTAQGYHLSKPVPAMAVTRWLAERTPRRPPVLAASATVR